jgi:hypothetical protein
MKVVFHIAALKEFRDERRYYNARAPHSFPRDRKHPRARRARLRAKFPHALIFTVIEAEDVVILVALEHARRKPGAWAKRLR